MNAIERGQLAADVLANPVYVEAYDLIEKGIYSQWRDSKDSNEREQLHKLHGLLGKARKLLETTMEQGKFEAASIERKAGAMARIGRAFRTG